MILASTCTRKELRSKIPLFVFIHPEADMNPTTKLPYDDDHYEIVDIFDIVSCGTPYHSDDDVELEFYAIIPPNEQEGEEVF